MSLEQASFVAKVTVLEISTVREVMNKPRAAERGL